MHLIIIVWHRASVVLIVVGDVSRSVCYSVTSGGYCEMILMITDIIGRQSCLLVVYRHKSRQGRRPLFRSEF